MIEGWIKRLLDRRWIKRLLDRIDRSGGQNACWPWIGGLSKQRYGRFWKDKRDYPAHVLVLELRTGEKAGDRQALHTCDNPPCCNPDHLFWGTDQDNKDDMVAKR